MYMYTIYTHTLQIIELMSLVLEVNHMEIKETVRRDRCDWLASIFNLLLDQPEGCNFLQQLVTGDPEDQLVDAATYHGSIENMQLSQKANDGQWGVVGLSMLYMSHILMSSDKSIVQLFN